MRMQRWLPQVFGGVYQPGNPHYSVEKLGTLLESPGLGFVASLSVPKKKCRPRPDSCISWHYIRQRVHRKKLLVSCRSFVKRPPLPPQEVYYAQCLQIMKEHDKVPRRRGRPMRRSREFLDRKKGNMVFDRILRFLREKTASTLCSRGREFNSRGVREACVDKNDRAESDKAIKQVMAGISFVSYGKNVVKRHWRRLGLPGGPRLFVSGESCMCLNGGYRVIRIALVKPAASIRVKRDIDACVRDDLHEMGLEYKNGKLAKLPALFTPSSGGFVFSSN